MQLTYLKTDEFIDKNRVILTTARSLSESWPPLQMRLSGSRVLMIWMSFLLTMWGPCVRNMWYLVLALSKTCRYSSRSAWLKATAPASSSLSVRQQPRPGYASIGQDTLDEHHCTRQCNCKPACYHAEFIAQASVSLSLHNLAGCLNVTAAAAASWSMQPHCWLPTVSSTTCCATPGKILWSCTASCCILLPNMKVTVVKTNDLVWHCSSIGMLEIGITKRLAVWFATLAAD